MHNRKLIFWALTSALAGFLFGFDTVVISGAERAIQDLWQLHGFTHGLAISMALWGTVIGSVFGGLPTARFGCKKVLVAIGVLYFVSAVFSGQWSCYAIIYCPPYGSCGKVSIQCCFCIGNHFYTPNLGHLTFS